MKSILDDIKRFVSLNGLKRTRHAGYKTKLTLLERVASDLSKGDHAMAIRRLEGFLKYNPLDEIVLDKLATIFNAYGMEKKAGRYWYLHTNKVESQLVAVKEYEQSLGNDPTLILKKLITKTKFSFSRLRDDQILILANLLNRVKEKEGTTPKFLRGLENHF